MVEVAEAITYVENMIINKATPNIIKTTYNNNNIKLIHIQTTIQY